MLEDPRLSRNNVSVHRRDNYEKRPVLSAAPFTLLSSVPLWPWWALEKEKTIYKRDSVSEQKWMPDKRIPNEALFKGFQLKID